MSCRFLSCWSVALRAVAINDVMQLVRLEGPIERPEGPVRASAMGQPRLGTPGISIATI